MAYTSNDERTDELFGTLVSKANAYDVLEEFFEREPEFKEHTRKLLNDGCYSSANIMGTFLEEVMERLRGYEEEEEE